MTSSYRERLEVAGLLAAFEAARVRGSAEIMTPILLRAGFGQLEIDSILWAKGDLGAAPTAEEKSQRWRDLVIGRIGIAVLSGLILGGVFVYASATLGGPTHSGRTKLDIVMSDYRSPSEAYYHPFVWGFVVGAVVGLVTGTLFYDPTEGDA